MIVKDVRKTRRVIRVNPAPGWPAVPEDFSPAPDWEPGADWVAAPPGWPRLIADRAVERPRFWGWPHPVTSTLQAAAWAADRKPSGRELLVVLAIFPGLGVFAAIDTLIQRLVGSGITGGYVSVLLPGHTTASVALDLPASVLRFVPAFLVGYLLTLSGGGLAAIGLDRQAVRADLARAGKLLFLAFIVPFGVAGIILIPAHVSNRPFTEPPSLLYLIPLVISAVSAGVVEEIVVLGYLVHRLEQRGWSGGRLVAVCVAVRVSYHLYYGLSVLGIVGWATVSVLLYRRRRRLLTFIVVHAMWDTFGFVIIYIPKADAYLPLLALVAVTLILFVTGRRSATPPR